MWVRRNFKLSHYRSLFPVFSSYSGTCEMPVEEQAEGRATVAVLRFFFRRQFGEGFFNGRKIKQRVIPESTRAAGRIEQQALRLAAKYIQDFPVASDGDHAHEPGGTLFGRNFSKFTNQTGIVGLIVGVVSHQMRLVSGIACGVNSGSAAQRDPLRGRNRPPE